MFLESAPSRARAPSRAQAAPHRPRRSRRPRRARRRTAVASLFVGILAAALGLHDMTQSAAAGRASDAAGLNDLGEAVASDLPARCAGFDVRRGGAWTQPGAQPFRGDPYCAIVAAGIPEPHASGLADDIRRGDAAGTVTFSAEGIEGGGRRFADRMDMSYGNGLSLGQRVGFDAPRTERGLLFQRAGYWVAVPQVCGNVTRLYARLADESQAGSTPPPRDIVGDPLANPTRPPAADLPVIGRAAPKRLGGSSQSGDSGLASPGLPAPFGAGGLPHPWDTPMAGAPLGPESRLPVEPTMIEPAAAVPTPGVGPLTNAPLGVADRFGRGDDQIDPQGAARPLRDTAPTPMPEPGSLACVLAGCAALAGALRRRQCRPGQRPFRQPADSVTPAIAIARSKPSAMMASAREAPASPKAATPWSVGRPTRQKSAPAASARATSVPLRIPPSTSSVADGPTAARMAGSTDTGAGAASSWRPPWADTTTASAPQSRARTASSGWSTPLTSNVCGHRARTARSAAQSSVGSICAACSAASDSALTARHAPPGPAVPTPPSSRRA